jgi:SOS-response transcriptional repressor LexA
MPKKRKKGHRAKHFRDTRLLGALGQHCQKLRVQRGYSIDRLAKESDQLSTSVIHRLESGKGAVTVSAVFRYAVALNIAPKELFDIPQFEQLTSGLMSSTKPKIISLDDQRIKKEAFHSLLPLYSLKAAAGYFGAAGEEVTPEGWIEAKSVGKLDSKMFVTRVAGHSMEPKIHDGDYVVFRADPVGTRQGKIVLAQYRGPSDPETGGSYTIKQYHSSKVQTGRASESWVHKQISLSPLNSDYEPILLYPKDKEDFRIVAEFICVLFSGGSFSIHNK